MVGQLRLDGLQPAAGMGGRPLVEVGFDLDVPRLMWLRSRQGRQGGQGGQGGLRLDVCHISVRLSTISLATQLDHHQNIGTLW